MSGVIYRPFVNELLHCNISFRNLFLTAAHISFFYSPEPLDDLRDLSDE